MQAKVNRLVATVVVDLVMFLVLGPCMWRALYASAHPGSPSLANIRYERSLNSSPQAQNFENISNAFTEQLREPFPMSKCQGHIIEGMSIDYLQYLMQRGHLNATALAECFVDRIQQINPYVNAVLELNPDYLAIAEQLDADRRLGHVRGPLHGIPFLVKDNIASKDKMQTTAGSWALLGSVVPRDAFVVRKLRAAGALLLGKATLSEWADMRSSNYSEGYSARGGQARSAFNFTVNPGGSSSGSAIAVSCNIVPFALGTETDGSVINPAERNSVVGIKPTVGLTSRDGVVPECLHQDTVGVFAKSMRDAVYALDAIYGVDPRDSYTIAQAGRTPVGGYIHSLTDRRSLHGARFGIPWRTFWELADADQTAKLFETLEIMRSAGAQIFNNTELPDSDLTVSPTGWDWKYGCGRGRPDQCEYTVVTVDFYNDIRAYLSELGNTKMHSLEDLVAYNFDNDGTEGGTPGINPAFGSGQDGFLDSLSTKGVMNETYWSALNWTQRTTRRQIDACLRQSGHRGPLDALLVPSDVAQAPQIAAQAGYPMVTVPLGVHSESHMPFGLGLMNTAFSESALIKWASAIEDELHHSHPRTELPSPGWHGYLDRNLPVTNA